MAIVATVVVHLITPYDGIDTEAQMLVPEAVASVNWVVETPTPLALAVMRDPAGDTTPTLIERSLGVKVIPSLIS